MNTNNIQAKCHKKREIKTEKVKVKTCITVAMKVLELPSWNSSSSSATPSWEQRCNFLVKDKR